MTMNHILITALLALGAPLAAADAHAGHDHGDHAGHAHGEAKEIGTIKLGAQQATVKVGGAITAGTSILMEIELSPATPAPTAVRFWVGVENGRGSTKAKAAAVAGEAGAYTAHVEVPSPLPAGSAIWVACEGDQAVKGSVAIK